MMDVYEFENFIEIQDNNMDKKQFKKIQDIISQLDCRILDCEINHMRCFDVLKIVKELDGEFTIKLLLQKRGGTWQSTLI